MHRFTCSMLLVPVTYQIIVCVFIFVCIETNNVFQAFNSDFLVEPPNLGYMSHSTRTIWLTLALDLGFFVMAFSSDIQSLTELITAIVQRMGDDIDRNNLPQILVFLRQQFTCFLSLTLEFYLPNLLLIGGKLCSMKTKTVIKLYWHQIMILQQLWNMQSKLVGRYDYLSGVAWCLEKRKYSEVCN